VKDQELDLLQQTVTFPPGIFLCRLNRNGDISEETPSAVTTREREYVGCAALAEESCIQTTNPALIQEADGEVSSHAEFALRFLREAMKISERQARLPLSVENHR
jgi:hypothetical protein